MRRNLLLVVAHVLLLVSFFAAPVVAIEVNPEELRIQATETLQGILAGLSEGDYGKYTEHFAKSLKGEVDRDTFLQIQRNMQRKLGKFNSQEYLGFYSRGGNVIALFKARFTKEKDDVLISLVLERVKGNPVVAGIWFDAPSLQK